MATIQPKVLPLGECGDRPGVDAYPPDGRQWGLDNCHTAKFVPGLRTRRSDMPHGDGVDGYEQDFWEIRTAHPVRAMATMVGPSAPACREHWGKMCTSRMGYAAPQFCTQPMDFDVTSRRSSICALTMQDPDDLDGELTDIEPGFWYWLGAYETRWTEIHLHSFGRRCGTAV